MNNYNYNASMSKQDKDRMCDKGSMQENHELIKLSTNTNGSKKSTLKRTESKMDENNQESDDYSENESEFDEMQCRVQGRPNQRGNKAPRIESFVQERTITSSVCGGGRTEKNQIRHISKHQERTKEKKNDKKQLSNVENEQYDSSGDVQYLDEQNHEQIYVSRHALKFAVDERFSPLRIKCEPAPRTHIEASALVKELLKQIEQKFKKLNPRHNNPLGIDHYMIDENGDLVWFTKYIELFIFLCDNSNYPTTINSTNIQPLLPKRLPAKNAIILKFIDNKIKFEEVQNIVKEKLHTVYSIEEMLGTIMYRSRHIRIDLLSNEECTSVLNSGKFVIDGHLYEVDEYLPSPRLLICNKCNTAGHIKKNGRSTIEVCKRCGNARNDGSNHKICTIKFHHCGDEHEAASFSCTTITKFRQELLNQLKNNTHLLSPHVQFYIPQQFRDRRGKKVLTSNNNINRWQPQRDNPIIINPQDHNV